MDNEKLQKMLKAIYNELNINQSDEEYIRYLEEKIIKAYNYEQKHNLSDVEFIPKIKRIIPDFIEQYERIKNNILIMSSSDDSKFGISINFQLIDLFKIAEGCKNNEEFITLRNEYFKNLGNHPAFQDFDYIFPGIKDITYEEILRIHDNIISDVDCITPEWAGKMRCIIDTRKPLFIDGKINMNIFNFELLDKVADFARENNMKLRMHNIIWHKDFRPFLENAAKDEIYQFLDTYMNELGKRYSDIFYSIDVLNEIASDYPNEVLRDSKWKDKLGEDYYINILRIAKKNFPNTELYYNEYGEERPEKRKNIIEIINSIKKIENQENITLLDGIGIQSHYSAETSDEQIKDAYNDYSKTGKKMQITELDVGSNTSEEQFDYQTNRVFRTVLDCATSYKVKLVNIWGVSSRISWKSGRVNNYMDKNGINTSFYSEKIINAYSKKRKLKKQKQTSNITNNNIITETSKNIK